MISTDSVHFRRRGSSHVMGFPSPRVKSLLALMLLCLAPVTWGCGGSEPSPSPRPDAGTQRPDAGASTNDAGTDAGTEDPDAGEPPPAFTLQQSPELSLRFRLDRATESWPVVVLREPTFTDAVSISVEGLPEHVSASSTVVAEGEIYGTLEFSVTEFASYGIVPVTLVARAGEVRVEQTQLLNIQPSPAALDTSFGNRGVAAPAFGHPAVRIHAVAPQPDGKWILAGATGSTGLRDVLVARLLANGTLDPDFGTQGTVTLDVCGGDDYVDAVTVLSDGRILVAGGAISGPGDCSGRQHQSLLFARYTPAGTLDTTLGGTGVRTFQLSEGNATLHAVTVDSQGRIVGAGTAQHDDLDFVIMRLTPTGAADTTFSSDGLAWEDLGEDEDGLGVVTQADDRIVVVGTTLASTSGMTLRRYNVNGTVDRTFSYDGQAPGIRTIKPRTLHLLAGDALLVGGTAQFSSGTTAYTSASVTRLHSDGKRDVAFGIEGTSTGRWSAPDNPVESLVGAGILPGGELVLAAASTIDGVTDGIGRIHLSADGKTALRAHRTNLPGTEAALTAALHSDGSMCVAGLRADQGTSTSAPFAARFWPYE